MNSGLSKNNRDPFFSIIIPVFNGGRTISTCLDKILEQSFQNFEIVAVDGLSQDNTIDILSEYRSKFENLRIISEKDNGVYDAMNKGIDASRGIYLYFSGCDDSLFDSHVLEAIHQKILVDGYPDIIYGSVLWGESNRIYDGEFNLAKLYYKNICHQSIFYHRQTFIKIGKYDSNYPVFADWHFNFKCFSSKLINVEYCEVLIARFGLGGLSGVINDTLPAVKYELFLSLAKQARITDYYNFRRSILDKASVLAKLQYLFFYFLFFFSDLYIKVKKG